MTTVLILLGVWFAYRLLGAVVMAWIDREDLRLLRWYKECPRCWGIAWGQIIFWLAWPLFVWVWCRAQQTRKEQ